MSISEKIHQFFCKHDWEITEQERFSDIIDGQRSECFSYIEKCKKCGKIRRGFERT